MSYGGIVIITGVDVTSLEVNFNDNALNPGFRLTLIGLSTFDKFRLLFKDPDGIYPDQVVRGTDMRTVSGDVFSVTDYEFPNFRSQIYVLELYKAGVMVNSAQLQTDNLPSEYFGSVGSWPNANAWLRSPTQPQLTRPCFIDEYTTYSRPGRVLSKDYVLGRKLAVESTDVLAGREGSFTFHCGKDFQTWSGMDGIPSREYELLLDRGSTLLLDVFDDDNLECTPLYFRVDNVQRERIGRDGHTYYDHDTGEWVVNTYPVFKYSVDYVEIDRPPTGTSLVSEFSWQTIKDNNATWQENKTDHSDWLDVLANPTV